MIGIDITTISRFENKSETFIKRFLSKEEFIQWDKKDIKFLAARWAIKEALYKADNALVSFNEITISHDGKRYLYPGYLISTSDEKDTLIAMVLKEEKC